MAEALRMATVYVARNDEGGPRPPSLVRGRLCARSRLRRTCRRRGCGRRGRGGRRCRGRIGRGRRRAAVHRRGFGGRGLGIFVVGAGASAKAERGEREQGQRRGAKGLHVVCSPECHDGIIFLRCAASEGTPPQTRSAGRSDWVLPSAFVLRLCSVGLVLGDEGLVLVRGQRAVLVGVGIIEHLGQGLHRGSLGLGQIPILVGVEVRPGDLLRFAFCRRSRASWRCRGGGRLRGRISRRRRSGGCGGIGGGGGGRLLPRGR